MPSTRQTERESTPSLYRKPYCALMTESGLGQPTQDTSHRELGVQSRCRSPRRSRLTLPKRAQNRLICPAHPPSGASNNRTTRCALEFSLHWELCCSFFSQVSSRC